MEIDWVILGWLIDMTLNGFVWLVIAIIFISIINMTDTWTKKALEFMVKADELIRNLIDNLFDWIEKKNLIIGTAR